MNYIKYIITLFVGFLLGRSYDEWLWKRLGKKLAKLDEYHTCEHGINCWDCETCLAASEEDALRYQDECDNGEPYILHGGWDLEDWETDFTRLQKRIWLVKKAYDATYDDSRWLAHERPWIARTIAVEMAPGEIIENCVVYNYDVSTDDPWVEFRLPLGCAHPYSGSLLKKKLSLVHIPS